MTSAMLTGIRQIKLRETPDPRIENPNDVLLQVSTVGICGSDVHYYKTGRIGSQVVEYPFPVGHEAAGTVLEVGSGVTRVRPGDRVAIDPAMPCFECDQCLAGRSHTCRKLRFLGCPGQAPGCLAERIVMPETSCFILPDTLTLTQGALSEPLAIGVYAVRRANLPDDACIGILGAGPVGLCVLASARAVGCRAAVVTEPIPERRALAVSMGAESSCDPADLNTSAQLNTVFECCGQQSALDQGIDLLNPGGTLVVVGIPEVDRVSFSIDLLRRKEITIVNVRRQEGCVQATLDLMASGAISIDRLVTHRFPLDRIAEAFELVADYRDGVVKALIEIG
ncbi:MAG: alcohol dehydrogenase catalytic domain-containing protein [Armatimonadetes bacterium]|jgi:L-iditol 2-dehydrogenase|nr:alcohol dehydrogenase catalytic domain-containing protein [Armatimonadota bacterium]